MGNDINLAFRDELAQLIGSEHEADMSISEFIKENIDVPTLLKQMRSACICIDGIGGQVCLRVYGEKDSTLECVAENLSILTADKRANCGIGVLPETVCGPIEIIERLKTLSNEGSAIVAFFETGRGETGLQDAITKISGDFFFRLAAEFAVTAFIHERVGSKTRACEDFIHSWPHILWNVHDFIVYQTKDRCSPHDTEVLALMGLSLF